MIIIGDFKNPNFVLQEDWQRMCLNNWCTVLDTLQYNIVLNQDSKLLDLHFASIRCNVSHYEYLFVKADKY